MDPKSRARLARLHQDFREAEGKARARLMAEIQRQLDAGETQAEIARAMGISKQAVFHLRERTARPGK